MSHQQFYEPVQMEESMTKESGVQNRIAFALVKAQIDFAPALKTKTNDHFKSRYADLASCVEAVIDALNAHGIFLHQRVEEYEGGVAVETIFLHESGDSLNCGVLKLPASKNDPQGYMSALTYARRGSLMAACGIAPEDDEGNAAVKAQEAEDEKLLVQYKEQASLGMAALQSFHSVCNGVAVKRVWTKHGDMLKAIAKKADAETQPQSKESA